MSDLNCIHCIASHAAPHTHSTSTNNIVKHSHITFVYAQMESNAGEPVNCNRFSLDHCQSIYSSLYLLHTHTLLLFIAFVRIEHEHSPTLCRLLSPALSRSQPFSLHANVYPPSKHSLAINSLNAYVYM